jgi:hypothetical protein
MEPSLYETLSGFRSMASVAPVGFPAFFIELNKSVPADDGKDRAMEFSGAAFAGRIYFQNSRLGKLSFSPSAQALGIKVEDQSNPSRQPVSPTTIAGRSAFSGLRVSNADFSEVEFRDYADFSAARFSKFISLQGAVFEQEANFSYAGFPPVASSVLFNGVQFQRPVRLEWRQIDGKVRIEGSDGWRRLEDAFKQSGELQGQNECSYRRQLAEGAEKEEWDKVSDKAAFWFWGYGLRPLRVLGWITLLYLLFSALYFTQTGALTARAGRWQTFWKRARFALTFALRSSWSFSFGYQNAHTNLFRFFTSVNSIAVKVMLIFRFKAVTNLSPLLNDVVHKLVPL